MEKKKVNMDSADATRRYERIVAGESGLKAVRPYRADGFVNMLNKYGTSKDTTEYYTYEADTVIPDDTISEFYEDNGLFAKIIDAPAEEAIKHGFKLKGIEDDRINTFYQQALDELDWEETGITCLKWMRLYGGCIAVMLVNDGKGLEEPLDWKNIKSIDDIRIFDRSIVTPDYASMYNYDNSDPFKSRGSRLGHPERYHVSSRYGSFDVHETRCLIFQNGVLPENSPNSVYQLWGVPEYVRIHKAVQDVEVSHGYAPKMLDRSVQAIYKMRDLAMELSTEEGESRVLKRLETIDMARGLLNSIVLDADGEEYDFRSFSYTGVSDVINTTCNYLSAVTNIPQTILFGRSPAGMNATGGGDLENYYNYVERIQKRVLKQNLRYLLTVIFQAGKHTKEIDKVPKIDIEFEPLWSLSETEQVALEAQKAGVEATKAQTASAYVQMQAIDPSEVRKKLADDGEFDVETMLDDFSDKELEENDPAKKQQGMGGGDDPMAAMMGMLGGQGGGESQGNPKGQPQGMPQIPQGEKESKPQKPMRNQENMKPVKGNSPDAAPEATKLPEDMQHKEENTDEDDNVNAQFTLGVGVLVVKDGKVLTGTRIRGKEKGTICGPGGHVEDGESSEEAGIREAYEEFSIVPREMVLIGKIQGLNKNLPSDVYLCTEYVGKPKCESDEMRGVVWRDMNELHAFEDKMFTPFAESLKLLGGKEEKETITKQSWGENDEQHDKTVL